MGEDDESFATNAGVPSFVDSSSNAGGDSTQDVFVELFVKSYQNLIEPDTLHDVSAIESMLNALLAMKLNLPENAEARESISRTNIIECLTKTMAKAAKIMATQYLSNVRCDKCNVCPIVGVRFKCGNCIDYDLCQTCFPRRREFHDATHCFLHLSYPLTLGRVALHPIFSSATRLMGDLISGSHTENIKECHKCGALPLLAGHLSYCDGHHCSHVLKLLRIDDCSHVLKLLRIDDCSHVLKLLRIDGDDHQTEEILLDLSSFFSILVAMNGRPDLQEWGCSRLYYVLEGWYRQCPSEDVCEAFLKSGAMDAILNAIGRNPTGSVAVGLNPAPINTALTPNTASAPNLGLFTFGNGSLGSPTPGTVRVACKCILILTKKSPDIRSTLLEKGVALLLSAALQKQWPTTDIHGHCQQALLAVLGSPM